jgi:hypothetical protein
MQSRIARGSGHPPCQKNRAARFDPWGKPLRGEPLEIPSSSGLTFVLFLFSCWAWVLS